jgi:hypothetical protein
MTTGYLMLDQPNPYTAQGTYPRRGVRGKLTGTCILHTTEGAWQAGVQSLINLVRSRSDYGCYHRACDWEDIALLYPWEWETWQDSETNNWAVGISAACRTTDWRTMPADIAEGYYRNMARMAADFVNYMKTTYGITVPLKRISGAQARAGVPGFAAHGDSGVSRSDPGADFDWAKFFAYTRQALGGAAIAPQGNVTKDWFDMATEAQLRKIIREEGWAYKNPNLERDDAYALLRAARTYAVKAAKDAAAARELAAQVAKGQGTAIDYAKIEAAVKAAIGDGVDFDATLTVKKADTNG